MRWETVALLVFGFLCGMTVMYILNRRQRIQEFNKIAEITEDILKDLEDEIQKMTDKYIAEIDKKCEAKCKDILAV